MNDDQRKIFCELGYIHNKILLHKAEESELTNFVVKNKDQLVFPQTVEVLMTNIRVLDTDFINENRQLCEIAYELLMKVGIDKLDFREAVRASSFIDTSRRVKITFPYRYAGRFTFQR